MGFSKDFVWGVSTAAYQIEGAYNTDGKGLNVWDIACMQNGFVRDGDTGNTACDHYHLYKEDVKLMKEMGVKAYRFSISWARVLPEGIGAINEAGMKFYENLVDLLLENGIEPYVTLFHWDYPVSLFEMGGWLNRDSSDWFAEYTKIIVKRLGDRVTHWMTINEPQCFINIGHADGIHAPGLKLNRGYVLKAMHNSLLAHGKSAMTIREYSPKKCEIGFAPVAAVTIPQTDSKDDIQAAKDDMFSDYTFENCMWKNSLWMDPVYLGIYPNEAIEVNKEWWPEIKDNDLSIINQPLDFFGMNSYQGATVKKGTDKLVEFIKNPVGYPHTDIKWPITPQILKYGPEFFYERYKLPILVTENGMANLDFVSLDGKVHDPQRIDFLNRYLKEYQKAADNGVDLKGYLQWSFMDNFEWSEGYNQRFGLVYVDYNDKKRIIKDSGYWYMDTINSNGNNL